MSKPVRLKDYLADELEKMAARENRSLANLVNHLLEQAIEMDARAMTVTTRVGSTAIAQHKTTPAALRNKEPTDADAESRDVRARTLEPAKTDDSFRPDPKPEKKR